MRGTIAAVFLVALAAASCSAPAATLPPSAGAPASVAPTSTPASPAASPEAPTLGPSHDPSICTQFDDEATYTAMAGTLPVSVTVPATASSPWSGLPDEFDLRNAPCDGSGSLWINASLVAHVYADSCHWKGSSVEAPTVRDVMGKLLTQLGHETSPAPETHLGIFKAQRLDLSVPASFDATTCDDGVLGLWDTPAGKRTLDSGATVQVYVAEVDGVTLVLTAGYRTEDATPDLLAEINSLLTTLRVDM